MLLAVQATRAVHVFEAILANVGIGRGVAASMLNRALLEDVLSVHWVAANKAAAPGQADRHERATSLGERRLMHRHARPDVDPLTDQEEAELNVLAREFDGFQLSWTGEKPAALEALVRDRVQPSDRGAVDFIYEVVQRQNNTLLHASPAGYSLAMSPGRANVNRAGPDERWPDALSHGAAAFYLIFRLIAQEFALDYTKLGRLNHLVTCLAKRVPSGELDRLALDDQCPCGSGRAVGRCHRLA